MRETVSRHWRALAAFVVIGTALYGVTFNTFFVSDDFEFLTIVASAKSWLVIFEPLVGRYVRPFVVLMYYLCYQLFGLSPWPYHVATLLPHLVSTFLLYLVALRLFSGSRFLAFLAALLFLAFSGHSEAVAWPAGIADPIVAMFLLTSLLCYLRSTDPGTSPWYVFFAWFAVLGAVLTKEVWVSYPGIVLAHAVLLGDRTPRARRRAAILVVATGATVLAYLVMRQTVFGSVTGGYSGLGTSFGTSIWLSQVRAFVLRCFLPAGTWTVRVWRGVDLVLWPLVAILLVWRLRRRNARVLLFTAAAMMLALAPVLPLTISVATTESERFIYVATAFSCLLIVSGADAILRSRVLVATACGLLLVWHSFVLVRHTIRWREAGEMAHGIVHSFADGVRRYDPGRQQPIFMLNLPDNLLGAYVYRRGFYPAIQLFAPDVASSTGRTRAIATNSFAALRQTTSASQTAPDTFTLDISPGRIIQPELGSATWYRIVTQTPTSYEVTFSDAITNGLIFHISAGRVQYVGHTSSRGVPFGSLENPADGAVCDGAAVRFSGWALDNVAVARVRLDEIGPPDAAVRAIGDAAFASGTRPDVTALFGWLPNSARAEWNFHVACTMVALAPAKELRVRVTAVDSAGQEVVLGTRVVKAAPN